MAAGARFWADAGRLIAVSHSRPNATCPRGPLPIIRSQRIQLPGGVSSVRPADAGAESSTAARGDVRSRARIVLRYDADRRFRAPHPRQPTQGRPGTRKRRSALRRFDAVRYRFEGRSRGVARHVRGLLHAFGRRARTARSHFASGNRGAHCRCFGERGCDTACTFQHALGGHPDAAGASAPRGSGAPGGCASARRACRASLRGAPGGGDPSGSPAGRPAWGPATFPACHTSSSSQESAAAHCSDPCILRIQGVVATGEGRHLIRSAFTYRALCPPCHGGRRRSSACMQTD